MRVIVMCVITENHLGNQIKEEMGWVCGMYEGRSEVWGNFSGRSIWKT
jgi:hypothetical protein